MKSANALDNTVRNARIMRKNSDIQRIIALFEFLVLPRTFYCEKGSNLWTFHDIFLLKLRLVIIQLLLRRKLCSSPPPSLPPPSKFSSIGHPRLYYPVQDYTHKGLYSIQILLLSTGLYINTGDYTDTTTQYTDYIYRGLYRYYYSVHRLYIQGTIQILLLSTHYI